jgi:hypothetical protein
MLRVGRNNFVFKRRGMFDFSIHMDFEEYLVEFCQIVKICMSKTIELLLFIIRFEKYESYQSWQTYHTQVNFCEILNLFLKSHFAKTEK